SRLPNPNLLRRSTVTASVTLGHALRYAEGSARGLLHQVMGHYLLVALTGIGFLFGLSVFLPSFLFGDWLAVELVNGSLEYRTRLIYDGIVNRTVLRIIYAALVVGALLLSSDIRIKAFGGVIAGSLIVTYAFYAYAFISVWCFFAAVLSAYLILVIHQNERRLPARDEPGRANLHG
uniref:DUF6629 family protein n=1 Tax=Limimaricola soesokkakensis TaxID=1343159 RepID=UPI003510EB0A